MRFLNLLRGNNSKKFVEESYEIHDRAIWDKCLSDTDFPYLISFPRTGSHWLRNVMELYFEKPSLVRVFYYKYPKEFTCFHIHDEDLKFTDDRRILYLYRNPIDTIYSQMNYYREDLNDEKRVEYWALLYTKHLEKYLLLYPGRKKTIISYDRLKIDFHKEFSLVTQMLLGTSEIDSGKLNEVLDKVSKEKIKNKVKDDDKVISSSKNYEHNKIAFIEEYKDKIMSIIDSYNSKINQFL